MMKPPPLVNNLGRTVVLGSKFGTGGEGSVFDIAGDPGLVAKLYHKPPPPGHESKLRAMVGLARPEVCGIAAWPISTLSERPGGPVIGFVMRRVKGYKEIHTLYSPAHRKISFPSVDWSFLAHTAANCAAAFGTLHAAGVVVGDVNQSNVMVADNGLVVLIDCDSFQVRAGGSIHLCEVGVPLFTPPELQSQSFRGRERTENHDRFGLAVLIFHLLFMGRHPFSGRYAGPGDMPIEQAIKGFRFVYGRSAGTYQMHPPLHALGLAAVTPELGFLFERAFGPDGASKDRPDPAEWYAALNTHLGSLRPCPRDPGHQTPSHCAHCVWCDLIQHGAPNFFVSVSFAVAVGARPGPAFVLAAVWSRIESVPRPRPTYSRPAVPSRQPPTPWPANVPSALPAKPAVPAILASPPRRPAPNLPPATLRRAVMPRGRAQRFVGHLVILFGTLLVPVILLGAVIGQVLSVRPKPMGWGLGLIDIVLLALCGLWWFRLELIRRAAEHRRNRRYEAEQEERRTSAREQLRAWEHQLQAQQAEARRVYQDYLRRWEGITSLVRSEAEKRRERFRAAEWEVDDAERAFTAWLVQRVAHFDRRKAELGELRAKHDAIMGNYSAEKQQLLARAREMQRSQFLQGVFINDHEIQDIGPTRKATLASFGVETAFDVEESVVLGIQGFGPKLTGRLLAWRAKIEARFVFNAAAGVPIHEERAVDFKYFQERQTVEARLLGGEKELQSIVSCVEEETREFTSKVKILLSRRDQAAADLVVIPTGA